MNISKILMGGRWKRVSPRGSRVVDGRKRINIMAVRWVFILEWPRILSVLRKPIGPFGENRERVGWFCKQSLQLRQIWNCLKRFSSEEKGKRIQINFNQARRKRNRGKKEKE